MLAFTESLSDSGARRWMYGAAVVADRLGKMIEQGHADEGLVPEGVFIGMRRFFQLVANSDGSCNLLESSSTGLVAAKALAASSGKPRSIRQFDETMEQFSKFFDSLNTSRELSLDELEVAKEMKEFFQQIEIAGERATAIPL